MDVVSVAPDDALSVTGATWFVSTPSAVNGEPHLDGFIEALIAANERVVVDVAYHGLCGDVATPVPAGTWAWLWSLSKPYGLFWRRVGILAASEPIGAAYGTRWFKDPARLHAAWNVVKRFEAHDMADAHRALQHEAIRALAGHGVIAVPASTMLLATVAEHDATPQRWAEIGRSVRTPGGVARICLTPLMERIAEATATSS